LSNGVILFDAALAAEVPTELVAVIVNVYACPEAKLPVTVNGLDVPDVLNAIEGLEVTV
jgi:hypothetical protein